MIKKITLGEIFSIVKCHTDKEVSKENYITGVASLERALEQDLSFISNSIYENLLHSTKARYIFVDKDIRIKDDRFIYCVNPSEAFSKICTLYNDKIIQNFTASIHPNVQIGEGCKIDKNIFIGANVIIGSNVTLEEGVVIQGNTYIENNSRIGKNTRIFPLVFIGPYTQIGRNCIIHSGVKLANDGFGYESSIQGHQKVPQIGNVIIENDVEIGANTCIDRARFDSTIIGEGTKIDNQVQIGHNVIIGKHCLICGLVGIAGSSHLGNFVVVGGSAKISGHLKIADYTKITANSFVVSNSKEGETLYGYPASDKKTFVHRLFVHKKIKKLEQIIKNINAQIDPKN